VQTRDVEYRDETVNLRGLFFDHQSGSRWFDDARTARYSARADRRAWASMRSLFDEVFGDDVRRA